MCNNPTTKAHTINVSATTAKPWPPTLSDGTNVSSTEGGDINFTTLVSAGDSVAFTVGGDVSALKKIKETKGNLFKTNPTAANNWTGIINDSKKNDKAEYSIEYDVTGAPDNPYKQDPKLQMN